MELVSLVAHFQRVGVTPDHIERLTSEANRLVRTDKLPIPVTSVLSGKRSSLPRPSREPSTDQATYVAYRWPSRKWWGELYAWFCDVEFKTDPPVMY